MREVRSAVQQGLPVGPDHTFHTDFSSVRGLFNEARLLRRLGVEGDGAFDEMTAGSTKRPVFLGGMRGSGKTSELLSIASKLHRSDRYFVVTCNIDQGLNTADIEYIDILIFKIERLLEELQQANVVIEDDILSDIYEWMTERVKETDSGKTTETKGGGGVKLTPGIPGLLEVTVGMRAQITGSETTVERTRFVLKNRFNDLARLVNNFLILCTDRLRKAGKGRQLLFIIDGLEKTTTTDQRRAIILNETNRYLEFGARCIYTLPIELTGERANLVRFADLITFPMIKIRERNGEYLSAAIEKFREFIAKRVDAALFDSANTIDEVIKRGGGSPRDVLRIIDNMYLEREHNLLDIEALNRSCKVMASDLAYALEEKHLQKLMEVERRVADGVSPVYDEVMEYLLERETLLEYNDGNYQRPHPLLRFSDKYNECLHNAGLSA